MDVRRQVSRLSCLITLSETAELGEACRRTVLKWTKRNSVLIAASLFKKPLENANGVVSG